MNLNHIAKKPFFDLFYAKPYMPQLLRAAMYDATVMNADGSRRGARATVLIPHQHDQIHSKELRDACNEVLKMKENGNHITYELSYADLVQIGGYAAVEYCGGPQMVFRMGRESVFDDEHVVKHDHETHYNSLASARFNAYGLQPEAYVALMGGVHTLGFMSSATKGAKTRWCMNPYVFDNTYFKEVLSGSQSKYYRTANEDALLSNPDHKHWVEAYAQDEALFFTNYAKAHVAISEETHEDTLLCEMADQPQVDGGYVEPSAWKMLMRALNGDQNVQSEMKQIYGGPKREPLLEIPDDHHH
jgi:catalase (peroxidase I)